MAEMMVVGDDATAVQAEVVGDEAETVALGDLELAARAAGQAETRAELARAPPEAARRLLEPHAVVLAGVVGVVQHPVHPVARVGARAGERHEVDVARSQRELAEQGVDGQARVARVVLQPGEALLGGTAHDGAVAQDRRRRAVGLGDAENDHPADLIRPTLRRCHTGADRRTRSPA